MKSKATFGALIAFTLLLTGCSAAVENVEENDSSNESIAVSPLGTWGTMDNEFLDLSKTWITFSSDGNVSGSSLGDKNCIPATGTWLEENDVIELKLSPSSCADDPVSSAKEAKLTEDHISLFDSQDELLMEIPFINTDPTLYASALSNVSTPVYDVESTGPTEDSNF